MTVPGQDRAESCFTAQSEPATDWLTETRLCLDLQSKTSDKQILQFASEELL